MADGAGATENTSNSIARKAREYIVITMAAFVASVLIGDRINVSEQNSWIIIVLQLTIFIIMLMLLQFFTVSLKQNTRFRMLIDDRSKFEGTWLEVFYGDDAINDGQLQFQNGDLKPRYALFTIKYLPFKDRYVMSGCAYYPTSLYFSFWHSRALIFYPNDDRLEYFFTGDRNPGGGNERGLGNLSFRGTMEDRVYDKKNRKRKVTRHISPLHSGMGYFIQATNAPVRYSLEFIRISEQEVMSLVGDLEDYHSALVMRDFLKAYHEKFGDKLKSGLVDPMAKDSSGRSEGL